MSNRQPVVHFPAQLEHQDINGELYGFYHSESNEYNVIGCGEELNQDSFDGTVSSIGRVVPFTEESNPTAGLELLGIRTAKGIDFIVGGIPCLKKPYNLIHNIFSRNSGILETNLMLDKCAIISGCGSVGSLVALELARAGVGTFVLIDNDTIAYHNLCRHQCGVKDVGKFKVSAVKERILQINPSAKVRTCTSIIERVDKEVFDSFCYPGTVIIGCADNREGDIRASEISCMYNVPFVSIGLWKRAFAGEIFYCLPGKMPCYSCVFSNAVTEDISNENASSDEELEADSLSSGRIPESKRFYLDELESTETVFEPGISVDIGYVTIIGIKLVIDILNQATPNYIPKVFNHLTHFTLICNTCETDVGGEDAEIFSYPLQVTTSIQLDYLTSCPPCQFL